MVGPPRPAGGRIGRRGFLAALPAVAAGAACGRRLADLPRTFRIALPYEVDSLDPHAAGTSAAFTVLRNVYEPLVYAYSSLGLQPGLAERWLSPDPLTWTFELRPGVRFHDGRPLEAKDVQYSFERLLDDPGLDMRYYVGEVAGVEAAGPRIVRVRARRRTPILLYKLAHVLIVPAGSGTRAQAGTGPYRVAAWDATRSVLLERNDDYWGQRPRLAAAAFALNADPEATLRGLVSGDYDMALLLHRRREWLGDATRHRFERRSGAQIKYLAFDLERSATPFCSVRPNPFLDRRVREAFHLALDRERLVSGLPGYVAAAHQLVPRSVFGFAPELPPVVPQPERARALLRAAGCPRGLAATLHTREILRDAAEHVAAQLRPVGLELTVRALPEATYFAGLKRREFSLWLDRWGCTTGDAAELFETALHSPDPGRGLGAFNESGYRSPSLDRAIERALELDAPRARRASLHAVMKQAMEELPWIPLFSDEEVWAIDRAYVWRPRMDYWLHVADVEPSA